MSVPDEELPPSQLSRRSMLRRTGLLGAGLAAGGVLGGAGQAAAAAPESTLSQQGSRSGGYLWLAGDHHIQPDKGVGASERRGAWTLSSRI
ncbi:hypothetical protein ACQPXS_46340 [Streptomyces sp. CA-142005]|uniref:hypothetical protein n=1 Tax=Streptomyces sp. CA-142005 TaxID=3240052 RepID=UPI003D8B69A5